MWKVYTAGMIVLVAMSSFLYYHNFFMDRHGTIEVFNQMASAVGVSVGVEDHEHSRIAQQLEERARELDGREESLEDLERQVVERIAEERRAERRLYLYVSLVGGLFFLLLSANFYLDMRRAKKRKGNA